MLQVRYIILAEDGFGVSDCDEGLCGDRGRSVWIIFLESDQGYVIG